MERINQLKRLVNQREGPFSSLPRYFHTRYRHFKVIEAATRPKEVGIERLPGARRLRLARQGARRGGDVRMAGVAGKAQVKIVT
jgi:hypothetical protein